MKRRKKSIIFLVVLALYCGCSDEVEFDKTEREKDGYTISYGKNGAMSGSVPVDGNIYQNGDTFTIPGNTGNLIKSGCLFDGWSDGILNYIEGSTFTVGTEDITLSAVWGPLKARWAKSIVASTTPSQFYGITAATDGSVYAAGCISGTATVYFDDNAYAAGAYSGGLSLIIVKYNNSGIGQWAKTVTFGNSSSAFRSVSVSSDGSVYAAGSIYNDGTFVFGKDNSNVDVTAAAGYNSGSNLVIVKYSSSGNPQWARTVTSASGESFFWGVSAGTDGSVYAAGQIEGTSSYDFGSGITVSGVNSGSNIILVKYDNYGNTQWVRTLIGGSNESHFYFVATASDGSVYAAGDMVGTHTYNFGNGVSVNAVSSSNNAVLVKYNSAGNAQWVSTITAGSSYSKFYGVSVSSDSTIYTAGYIAGTGTYGFGNNVTATGVAGFNAAIVKYNSSGTAQWAKSVSEAGGDSYFNGVSAGSDGVYAAGYITGRSLYNFGSGVTASGVYSDKNIILIRYNSSGDAEWVQTPASGNNNSFLNGVSISSDGSVWTAGNINGSGLYDFGNNVKASGTYYNGSNVLIVKYK